MKLAFACPFYGHTPPLVGDSFRANIINAQEAGHVVIDDYSVSNTQHRNACDVMALRAALDDRIDAVFWTEHDCILHPFAISLLAETLEKTPDADMVSGIVFRRCEPYNPMIGRLTDRLTPEEYEQMKASPDRTIRKAAQLMTYEEMKTKTLESIGEIDTTQPPYPVDTASLNCVLFRRDVFVKTKEMPDLFAVDQNGFFSIDNAFFLRLKDMGMKLYVDPRVLCGHLGDPEVIDARKWHDYTIEKVERSEIHRVKKIRETRGYAERIHGELTRLANHYATDKGTLDHSPDSGWHGWIHSFTELYEAMLDPIRLTADKILEIGIWKGKSLLMWRDYFPHAKIVGVDLFPETAEDQDQMGERIRLVKGNQKDRADLLRVAQEEGPFDVICDDGSHDMDDQQISLGCLFPFVKPGGWYIVEDCHTSFLKGTVEGEGYGNFGINADASNATIKILYALAEKRPAESQYMTPEELAYLNANVVECFIYGRKSMTAMIRKRT